MYLRNAVTYRIEQYSIIEKGALHTVSRETQSEPSLRLTSVPPLNFLPGDFVIGLGVVELGERLYARSTFGVGTF